MLGTEGTRHVSGMGSIVKVSNKRSENVGEEEGTPGWHQPSERSAVGRSRMRTHDPVQSRVFVTVICCLVLFVREWTGRTRPALLREVSPCGYPDQARGGELYHICTGF